MKNKKQKYFIVYEVEKDTDNNIINIINLYDFNSLKDVSNYLDIDYSNINKYISKTTEYDKINTRLKDNKYFIYKDYE